jgi:hypothetical protein
MSNADHIRHYILGTSQMQKTGLNSFIRNSFISLDEYVSSLHDFDCRMHQTSQKCIIKSSYIVYFDLSSFLIELKQTISIFGGYIQNSWNGVMYQPEKWQCIVKKRMR